MVDGRAPNGLRIPPRFSPEHLLKSPRFAAAEALLQQPGAQSQDYGEQIDDILALLGGSYRSAEGVEAHVIPGEGADVQVWILGSSGGESAEVAGRERPALRRELPRQPGHRPRGRRGYRAAFRPSAELARPYVSVSADVVVAEDEATARELATGYGLWVRSIRTGEGAIPFPSPAAGQGARLDRRGPGPGRRPGRHPVRRLPEAGRRASSSNCAKRPAPTS